MPKQRFVVVNEFSPSTASPYAEGRSSITDLTHGASYATSQNFATTMAARAYERLNGEGFSTANPAFDTGVAGRLISSLTDSRSSSEVRILRGYIRRSVVDTSTDPTSGYRLYFMYNPATVERQYVSYLDQEALDPFNNIMNSGNLVAPPSILDFNFELLFDRQTENANGSMPRGVLEDFDYFDLVVRGIVPDQQNPALPDNGIMMINPRNLTVVFSPQLSVMGRPTTASVVYEKFDHLMRPVRMRISLGMKAFYIGPVRSDFAFSQSQSEGKFSATIMYDESVKYTVTYEQVKYAKLTLEGNEGGGEVTFAADTTGGGVTGTIGAIGGTSGTANAGVRSAALQKAESLGENQYPYIKTRPVPTDPSQGLDCSGLVYWAYREIGATSAIGHDDSGACWTGTLLDRAYDMGTVVAGGDIGAFDDNFLANGLQSGDLILSHNQHVAFVASVDAAAGTVRTYESYGTGNGPQHVVFPFNQIYGSPNNHTHAIRPGGSAADSIYNIPEIPITGM